MVIKPCLGCCLHDANRECHPDLMSLTFLLIKFPGSYSNSKPQPIEFEDITNKLLQAVAELNAVVSYQAPWAIVNSPISL